MKREKKQRRLTMLSLPPPKSREQTIKGKSTNGLLSYCLTIDFEQKLIKFV